MIHLGNQRTELFAPPTSTREKQPAGSHTGQTMHQSVQNIYKRSREAEQHLHPLITEPKLDVMAFSIWSSVLKWSKTKHDKGIQITWPLLWVLVVEILSHAPSCDQAARQIPPEIGGFREHGVNYVDPWVSWASWVIFSGYVTIAIEHGFVFEFSN